VENSKSQYDQVLMQQYNSNGKVLIGSISTFIEQKGLFQLLDVMSELKKRRDDFICVIVGDGPLRPQLEERHRKLGLGDSVRFMGWIKNASITVLPALDIFVQSSLWEAMSIVVLEAMGAGKAIIVTDVGDNKHVVDNGKNGILVEKKDVAGMVEKLEQLIIDERLRKKLGQQAQEKVNRECTVTQTARNHEKLYREILEAVR
jgi:glycosyltransferase involved in cell wall biosynthesis